MQETKQYIKTVKELSISVDDITRYMSPNGVEVPSFFIDATKVELEKINNLKVKFGYHIFDSIVDSNALTIGETTFNVGDEILEAITNSERVGVFACTVSEELDAYLNSYNPLEDITEAYLSDIIGTVIVEKTTGVLSDYLFDMSKLESLKITNTQSPGNCGWDVDEQKKLFSILPNNYLGISLNESGMMHPVKSISGIIGIGKKVKFKHSECNLCTSANCMYRKEPFNGSLLNS